MSTWKWMITASLLVSLSAAAQQKTMQASAAAQPEPPQISQMLPAAQAPQLQAAPPTQPQQGAAPATTMDQVVDRSIEREHALMELLKNRTPLVDPSFQNLNPHPHLGPARKEHLYFRGLMDMGGTVARRHSLAKDPIFHTRLTAGFGKLFKFEYK